MNHSFLHIEINKRLLYINIFPGGIFISPANTWKSWQWMSIRMEISSNARYFTFKHNLYSYRIFLNDCTLSFIALPDGSHNFHEDSVYFNLPSLTVPNESVYGISCYRQMSVEVCNWSIHRCNGIEINVF